MIPATDHTGSYRLALIVLLLAGVLVGCDRPEEQPGDPGFYADDPTVDLKRRDIMAPNAAVEPENVLSTFEIEDGFRIELFAAEPLVTDPVAMEIDEDGRLYVVELHGYPDENGTSVVKQLTDTDGDGRPDEATVFADGMDLPKGIMRWQNGVIVTNPPDVLYLEDTDGDGRADIRRPLLTGFGTANPQRGVNNPIYGIDNWIYLAHMDPDTELKILDAEGGEKSVPGAARRNIRFRPDLASVDILASSSQFGHTFDAWGHHFLMTNSNPFYQEVIGARYLRRNPNFLVAATTQDLSAYGDPPLVYPITPDSSFALTNEGTITSASGNLTYLGGAFPPAYDGVVFVAEPIYNVVHAATLRKKGASFAADRLLDGREFLASTDRWFRPVNLYIGPDGAVYVLDYSRQIIEQPKFLTQEILESGNIYNGVDRGRIYRIVPEDAEDPRWLDALRISHASTEELVSMLESDNIWKRRTAQRLIVTRPVQDAVPLVRRLASRSESAEGRLHALWTLEGLGALERDDVEAALRDPAPGVRENAIQLVELRRHDYDGIDERLLEMTGETDPHVRYQLMLALGDLDTPEAAGLRERMLFDEPDNEWMQVAGLSAVDVNARNLFDRAVERISDAPSDGHRLFFRRLGSLLGADGEREGIRDLVRRSIDGTDASSWWRAAALDGLSQGLRSKSVDELGLREERELLLANYFEQPPEVRSAALNVLRTVGVGVAGSAALEQAASTAMNAKEDPQRRADAIRLVALEDVSALKGMLQGLVEPRQPAPVQQASVAALGTIETEDTGRFLLSRWETMTPAVRAQTIDLLLDNREWLFMLFDAIEANRVSPTAIPRHRDEDLVEHRDPKIRRRANRVLRRDAGERQNVVERYRSALQKAGNPDEGGLVFDRACAMCHEVGGQRGVAIGPDMATIENRPAHWLMEAILVPNKAIAEGHEFWTIERSGGETLYGVIDGETPTSITVRAIGGAETVVRRSDIESMSAAEASAMPEGLENQISTDQMADLLAFLMTVQTIN